MHHFRYPALLLGVTTALTLVAFDPGVSLAFDAPKRLVAMLGIALACAVAVVVRAPLRIERKAGIAAMVALGLLVVSALLSPRPYVALDAVRTMIVFAAVPLLCASLPDGWRFVANGFVAGALINAALSLVQWGGLAQPFRYETTGGRAGTSAFLGNTGILGLVLAFAAAILLPRWRTQTGQSMVILLAVALAVNQNVTGVLALGAAVLWSLSRRAAIVTFAIAVVAAIAYVFASNATAINYLLSYRLAPWSAAFEMFASRPWTGWGAGTFASEFMHAFLAGEERWGVRLAHPFLRGSYSDAHNDVLQALAELGLPVVLVLATLAVRAFRRNAHPVLVAGAVAALAWFPLQRPVTALVLLAALGVGLVSTQEKRSIAATIFAGLAIVFATFEIPRYAAERRLQRAGIAIEAERIETWPGDWRPLNAAASAYFLRGDYASAAQRFDRANALGERPEIDVNLALALDHLGQHERAAQLRARAFRVAPALSGALPRAPSRSPSSRRDTSR